MTDLHPLTPLLAPRSVAIFGASNDRERISGRSRRYFLEAGYSGALYPINPARDTVQGVPAYPDLASVPGPVDALAEALSRLSRFAAAQRGQFTSIDINPLLVRPRGAGVVALDALILTPI
jgi:predicted CoA-binding protein